MANEHYDALKTWREENFGKYKGCGGCEYDPTAEAIKAYEREEAKKQAQKKKQEQEQSM